MRTRVVSPTSTQMIPVGPKIRPDLALPQLVGNPDED